MWTKRDEIAFAAGTAELETTDGTLTRLVLTKTAPNGAPLSVKMPMLPEERRALAALLLSVDNTAAPLDPS